jgi:tRNA pseudouridine55 synthase
MKIGHAGTLDPFATGVLLLLLGRATKSCESLMFQPKQYQATLRLGATTPTDDLESPATPTPNLQPVPIEQVTAALPRFLGTIQQRPPNYSALKIAGRPAYKLARKGHDVDLPPRPVQIYALELLRYDWPALELRIDCGRGTYIRSLARDLGAALGVGAYLTALRRTAIGPFDVSNAVTLEQLRTDGVLPHLLPIPPLPPPQP